MHFNNQIMNSLKIAERTVGINSPTFIIAELSANHLHNFDLAVKTIEAMKEAGADSVKLQTALPDSITINSNKEDFIVSGGTSWDGRTLYDLYSETNTPWEWHGPLKKVIEDLGMIFFSSPFDNKAVDFLEKLNVPAYKIASFEITDIPLIRHTASKGKPIIMSTGIAYEENIQDAIDACKSVNNHQIILLKCTSAYPTPFDEVNLRVIPELQKKFNCIVGLSDHTLGSLVPLGATALGAKVIEKHFILDRKLGGPDSEFSMEPNEFAQMVKDVRILETALGTNEIYISKKVEKSRQFARSLYVVEDIKMGELFTEMNVRSIRPGHGLPPKYLSEVLGKKSKQAIEKGTPLNWDLIE